jgi:hypothetical protein
MDKQRKEEIITEYKQQKSTGGVYSIYNKETGKRFIKGDANLEAVKNRFMFSQKINSPFTVVMKADWAQYGPDSFVLEILEEIKMENEESPRAFRDRLKKLEEQWKEKYPAELRY